MACSSSSATPGGLGSRPKRTGLSVILPRVAWEDYRTAGAPYAFPVKLRYGSTTAPRLGISPATTAAVTAARPSDW